MNQKELIETKEINENELIETNNLTLTFLIKNGFTLTELKNLGYTTNDLKQAGWNLDKLIKKYCSHQESFKNTRKKSNKKIKESGFDLQGLLDFGFTTDEIRESIIKYQIRKRYWLSDLRSQYFAYDDTYDVKNLIKEYEKL